MQFSYLSKAVLHIKPGFHEQHMRMHKNLRQVKNDYNSTHWYTAQIE